MAKMYIGIKQISQSEEFMYFKEIWMFQDIFDLGNVPSICMKGR